MLIQPDVAAKAGTDWTGISVLLGVGITGFVTILNTFWNRRDAKAAQAERAAQSKVLIQTRDLADGAHKEILRQNVALKVAVASDQPVPEQVAGQKGNAPVGQDKGVITVEPDATARGRREGDL